MKKIALALITVILFGEITIKAQNQILNASEPINSGCLSQNNREEASSLPTIKLKKKGSILSVDLLNYVSNCGTTDFEVNNKMSGCNDDTPSVVISVVPVVPAKMDCTCPLNISYTVYGLEINKFYLTCWWYEGEVELTEDEPLVLEYKTEDVVIDGLEFTLLKTTHQAKLLFQDTWNDEVELLQIPSEVEYEGEKYSVTSINESVFASNAVTKQITIPKTIKNTDFGSLDGITSNLFAGCSSLETIEVDEENPAICSLDGVLFNKNKTMLISYPAASPRELYYVPDDVKTTAKGAFFSSQHLKRIVLPDNMETMGINLFGHSNSLEEVILPSNIKELPVYLFKDCKKLKSIVLPPNLTTIGNSAFEGCSSLVYISLPKSVATVGMAAFKGCTSLKSVTLSPNLREIPLAMFSDCSKLSEVIIPSGITSVGNGAFAGCEAMQSFDLPESINFVDGFAFGRLPNLKDIYCRSTTVPNTKNNAFYGTDLSQTTLHVPVASISVYQAVEPWKNFKEIVALSTQESDTDDSDYIPFVKENGWKSWHVIRSNAESGCHHDEYRLVREKVEKAGKAYVRMNRIEDYLTMINDFGLLREEERKVYIFDSDMQEEHLMFDYSLKAGDTYETYSYDEQKEVTYKVLSVSDYLEGPEAFSYDYDEEADSMIIRHRYLKKWTVCRTDDESVQKIWIEGVGSLEGPLANLYNERPISSRSYLAYVDNYDYDLYLPFSFYDEFGQVHGCNLPIGEKYESSEDGHHQLTYELEGKRLHVYGKVFCNCGPNHYAYFIEEPREQTDDPLVRKFHLIIQDVEPLMWCEGLHATDFYVEGVNPAYDYYIVDNQGEEHPVINKTPQNEYRPFVEKGKIWKVGGDSQHNLVQLFVEYYYFDGDTIIGGKTCKQMMRQRYVNPDYPDYAVISQYPMLSYVGAWYEEDKKVYLCNTTDQQFKLMYDFSVNADDILLIHNQSYVIGPKQTGGLNGFKGVYRDVRLWAAGNSMYNTTWLEGVGNIDGPIYSVYLGKEGYTLFLMSCTVGDEVIYLNDVYDDGATPAGARKRFDFTHTIKTKPKARNRSGAEAEQSLYGEYNDQQLGINLNPLDYAYLVSITDETGKVVYEKSINASNIVGLNIDISAYAKGHYTITVENSDEAFTGEFNAQATGIRDVRWKKEDGRSIIYNLQGQRLSTLQKGLNIVNGQKVFVK